MDNYEACGYCGFDHDYEPAMATAWHLKNPHQGCDNDYDILIPTAREAELLDSVPSTPNDDLFLGPPDLCPDCGVDHFRSPNEAYRRHRMMD